MRPFPELSPARLGRALGAVAALFFLVGCGGCSPLYVLRSAYEESRILLSRQSIERLLERPDLDPDTRAKLELVLEVRRFAASDLGLDVGDAYASFSIVPPGALLQVVSAAEQTQLVPYVWWFPIVGSVDYKGYFDREDALAEAARLERDGYDTYVRPSVAFSTLGWFDDPVLSSWLAAGPVRLTELLLHELLHRTWYVPGETAFNESLATFVGHVGAIEFFRARDGEDAETTRQAIADWEQTLAESRRLSDAVATLKALYATAAEESRPRAEVLAERARVFAELERARDEARAARGGAQPAASTAGGGSSPGAPAVPPRTPPPLNNAVILARYAYLKGLDAFAAVGNATPGGLRATIARLREASEGADDPYAALAAAAGLPPPP